MVAGLGLDLRVHEAFTVFLRGDNVGDTTYDSALGYPGLPLAGFTAMGTYAFVDTEVVTNQSTRQKFQPGQPLLRRPF